MKAQNFAVPNPKTTIAVQVNQSPAHWYIEIENLTEDSIEMAWVFDKSRAPNAWQFTFDDQNNYYNDLNHLDSNNFILYPKSEDKQKLIIGNFLNNRTGHASVFFNLYELATKQMQTIEYEFIITRNTSINETEFIETPEITASQNTLSINGGNPKIWYRIINLDGKIVSEHLQSNSSIMLKSGSYIIEGLLNNSVVYTKKLWL